MIEPGGELVVYRSADGRASVQLRAVEGTVWLAQSQIADLYGTSVPNIAQIIRRVLDDGEVSPATINSELRVGMEGARRVQREVKVYNLDMVLAIGYRVSTPRAVQFRDEEESDRVLGTRFALAQMFAAAGRPDDALAELQMVRPLLADAFGSDSTQVRNLDKHLDRLTFPPMGRDERGW